MKKGTAARREARRLVLQALYQMELTGDNAGVVESQFRVEQDVKRADMSYFGELLSGIANSKLDLLQEMVPLLDRTVGELDPVEKSILLIGCYELMQRREVPYRVAINEGVELAKQFGASESYRFINSILDAVARLHRQVELPKSV